ncbi:MAG: RDD family protein [ANME-2 cluster archaeon]|nr:RDD family protein [ANME-2 cluster archaeon]
MNEEMNEKADFVQRLIAYLIDGVLLGIVLTIVAIIVSIIIGIVVFALKSEVFAIIGIFVLYAVMFAIPVGYFTYFYGTSGQTIGKKMMKIKVVSVDGTPLTYTKGFVRVIGYVIASIPLYIGLIWMLFDENKQNWEDKIANTYVVKV